MQCYLTECSHEQMYVLIKIVSIHSIGQKSNIYECNNNYVRLCAYVIVDN